MKFFILFYLYSSYIPKMNAPLKIVHTYINDPLAGNLKANTIIGIKVIKEGKFRVAIDDKGETGMSVRVKSGKEYFFKCEMVKRFWFGKPTIEAVMPAV